MTDRGKYLEGLMEHSRRCRVEAEAEIVSNNFVMCKLNDHYMHRREPMGVRENKVERYLDEEVVLLGGLTRKWITTNHTGVPDRIVIIQGEVWFVEVKTLDGRLSSDQKREHRRLKDAGAKVATVYGKTGVDRFMEYFKC